MTIVVSAARIERRMELQRLGVDGAAVRTPRLSALVERADREAAAILSRERPRAQPSPMELAKKSATTFFELVAAKQEADGLSPGDAMIAAAREDPAAYDDYVRVTTLAKDGSILAAAVRPTIEKVKPVSAGGGSVSSAWQIIQDNTAEIMAATGCSQGEALERALSENPSLYAEYIQEFRRRTNSEFPAERG